MFSKLQRMNVIGFDDGPFLKQHRGDVLLVGAICAATRLDGVVTGRVRRDGADATLRMIELAGYFRHVRAVLLQGIAVAGFNVVDIAELSRELSLPVLVVMRREPDLASVRRALFSTNPSARPPVRGARRKWRLIERAGPIESLGASRRALRRVLGTASSPLPSGLRVPLQRLWIQRAGLSLEEARRLVATTTLHGNLPEPLRLAHIIAGGMVEGRSHGGA
jgi:uncharacterized protein